MNLHHLLPQRGLVRNEELYCLSDMALLSLSASAAVRFQSIQKNSC